ncbi:MAG: phenylalanine--tRNA ligase subunit beta [Planctomycetia bacterium]|nr:phenylalanine--tRNA ligase subunit beta [Planctomycetia bacterium]
MIISLNWLADYVQVTASPDALVERLLMAGLNHESTETVGSDVAIDLEVTSNRPDCLGHIGVAREAAVLFARPLHVPDPRPLEGRGAASDSVTVAIDSPEVCPCYSARVIRGVRVGPSPKWLVDRLATVGVESVNNVVDVTNYVMLECGQPLHAFDLARIRGGRIVVRRAADGEDFTAINHKRYALTSQMCVIADAERPVALAGVMGGADSEISADTVDVVLESAQFAPLAVRAAARGLALASPSSYRFERVPDPAAVEWASRRAAALILDTAGGTLEKGVVHAGVLEGTPAVIRLRPGRVADVLGVEIPPVRQHAILTGLGFVATHPPGAATGEPDAWRAPSWRRDVSREIDLVEEIARIEGYDRVPEDRPIEARPVESSPREVTVRAASEVLVGAGFCEAMTRSVVSEKLEKAASPWGGPAPLRVQPALVRGADRLRRTLLPSLLEARAGNTAAGAPHGELFEVARAYVGRDAAPAEGESPVAEPLLAAFVTGDGFFAAKGLVEAVLTRLAVAAAGGRLVCRPIEIDLFARGRAAEITLVRGPGPAERIAVVGEFPQPAMEAVGLKGTVAGAEVRLDLLEFAAGFERTLRRPSEYPAVERDVNLVVAADVPWAAIAAAIHAAAGPLLEQCRIAEVWQDAARLGAGRKSVVVTLRLRSDTGTLSGDDANGVVRAVVESCGRAVGAAMRA